MRRHRRKQQQPTYLDSAYYAFAKNLWTLILFALLGMFIYQVKVAYPAMEKGQTHFGGSSTSPTASPSFSTFRH